VFVPECRRDYSGKSESIFVAERCAPDRHRRRVARASKGRGAGGADGEGNEANGETTIRSGRVDSVRLAAT
jgi:hypothetical protein